MVYKDEKIGDWRIKNFVVDDRGEQMHNIREDLNGTFRYISAGTYTKLLYRTEIVMSNVPAEKKDHEYFFKKVINKKPKKILISGLGLGMIIEELLKHNFIERIVVVEKNKEVIELTGKYFTDKRLEIIHEDIFVYETEEKFDMVWHDIWTYIKKTNLREMNLLRGKFESKWQGFWCESEVRELAKSHRDNKMLENIFKAILGECELPPLKQKQRLEFSWDILDKMVDKDFLEKDNDKYKITNKFIEALMKFVKLEKE